MPLNQLSASLLGRFNPNTRLNRTVAPAFDAPLASSSGLSRPVLFGHDTKNRCTVDHYEAVRTNPKNNTVSEASRLTRQAHAAVDNHYQTGSEESLDEAKQKFRQAYALLKEGLGAGRTSTLKALHNLAVFLYHEQEDFGTAETLMQEALKKKEQALGAHHRSVAKTLAEIRHLYSHKGDHTRNPETKLQAEPYVLKLIEVCKQVYGPLHPESADALTMLSLIQEQKGDLTAAVATLKESLIISAANSDTNGMVRAKYRLGSVLLKQERYVEARPYFEELQALIKQHGGHIPGTPPKLPQWLQENLAAIEKKRS